MNRPRLINRTSATPSTLLQRAIFDGYDFGLKIPTSQAATARC